MLNRSTSRRYFDTHFKTQTIFVQSGEDEIEQLTPQLVLKGGTLVSCGVAKEESEVEVELVAGKNTTLADDQRSLIAATYGYPLLVQKKVGKTLKVTVSLTPMLWVDKDKMLAYLNIYPTLDEDSPASFKKIEKILTEEGVTVGVDEKSIRDCIERVETDKLFQKKVLICRGIRPINGKDSYLQFEVDVGPQPGKLLRDGSIDFRERKKYVGVEEGELIAKMIPATAGTPGKNVMGELLPQKPGRDLKLLASGDVDFDPELGEIRARVSGMLSIVKSQNIKVSSQETISSDIDYDTGNIESKNGVDIKGGVKPGFLVTTRGDVRIGGVVDSAKIVSKANVILASGLVGKGSIIKARGDVDVQFVSQGEIVAGGTVILRKEAYYSRVMAEGKIAAPDGSMVIGGLFVGGESVILYNAGSLNSEPGAIVAGVSPPRYDKYLFLKKNKDELQEKLTNMQQVLGNKAHENKKIH